MKISILKSCAGLTFSFVEGQEVDVKDELAKDLISAGYAKEVKSDFGKKNKPVKDEVND